MSAMEQSTTSRLNALAVRILVVDDEPPIRRLLRLGLRKRGYEVVDATSGEQGLEALACGPDLVILDIDLPDLEGFDVLRIMRGRGERQPVIILSGRDTEEDKVKALDLGADDYVVKPFGMNELMARIRTALRHALQARGERSIFNNGGVSVDLVRRTVMVDRAIVELSSKEYELLRLFIRHAGEALTYGFILQRLWTLDTRRQHLHAYVGQLRRKIESDPNRHSIIETIAGVGYRLRPSE